MPALNSHHGATRHTLSSAMESDTPHLLSLHILGHPVRWQPPRFPRTGGDLSVHITASKSEKHYKTSCTAGTPGPQQPFFR